MKDIEWIFFDMGGVLLDDTKPESIRQSELLNIGQKYLRNITSDDVQRCWLEASKLDGSLRYNALSILFEGSEYLSKAQEEYKVSENKWDYYGMSRIRPEAYDVLTVLYKKYKIGLMANQGPKASELLIDAKVFDYFSHQKMSAHIGLQKPNPDFYKHILEDTGASAEESVLIDDNWFRGLLQAQGIGMKTILFERNIIPYPIDANPNDRLNNLTVLLNIL